MVAVAAVLVAAAVVYAVADDKVANLLIGAAMVASSLAGFAWLMEKRLGDAYDTGGQARERALLRELAALRETHTD